MTEFAGTERPRYDQARMVAGAVILGLLVFAIGVPQLTGDLSAFTYMLLIKEDSWVVPLIAAACLLRARQSGGDWRVAEQRERTIVWLSLGAVLFLCWIGHLTVFGDFDVNRDERMVAFDAAIFREGALAWPIPPEWRALANALNRKFMLPIGSAEAWISAYLPVNAAFHALVGLVADDDLTAPLMVAAGGFFLWRIGHLLWPDSPGARLAALAFYAGSSQVLVGGMTKFAMSGHLALNLAWLWLFLRGGQTGHALAMLVGFLATGLHQPLFHPLFVLPFLALIASRRQWTLLAAYLAAYAAIGIFWMAWPLMMSALGTGPVVPVEGTAGIGYVERLLATVKGLDVEGVWLTAANLVRFVAWQHPLLVPAALFGAWALWRCEPLARSLAIGFVLPIVVMWLLLPWQGSGWGYRYLHPVIGNAALLGGWGWQALERRGQSLGRPLAWTTAAAVLLLFPLHAWIAFKFAEPKARVDRAIGALDADLAILDPQIFDDFVHNRHDLANRPIRLLGGKLAPQQLAALCRGRSIAFVDPPEPERRSARLQALAEAATRAGCASTTFRVQPDGSLSRH